MSISACLKPLAVLALAGIALASGRYADGGDEKVWAGHGTGACTVCHGPDSGHQLRSIERSVHAGIGNTPEGGNACEACHGPSGAHLTVQDGKRPPPAVTFSGKADAATRNGSCLTCHAAVGDLHWPHSAHARTGVACADCHTAHAPRDPATVGAMQADACATCHQDIKAALHRPSSHPVLRGAMRCTDCHDPHGGRGEAALVRDTVNETCYECHADKRGPFLWEHPPARENCLTCHQPHGSSHDRLLTQRSPWLCQQCHLAQFHPSTALSGTGVPPEGASTSMLGRNCMNCHTQVHGSNHPSGPGQTR